MGIDIYKERNFLLLHYTTEYPDGNNIEWIFNWIFYRKNKIGNNI